MVRGKGMAVQIAFGDTRLVDRPVLAAALDPYVEVRPCSIPIRIAAADRHGVLGPQQRNAIDIFSHGDSAQGATLTTLNAFERPRAPLS